MNFEQAVQRTADIADCLRIGLQALGAHSRKISAAETRDLTGSVDLDNCLQDSLPDAPRWDYVLGYKDRVYYVEVHPANAGEVKVVQKKIDWLRQWRRKTALESLRSKSTYHWIATGGVGFTKGSRQARTLATTGIGWPVRKLDLDRS